MVPLGVVGIIYESRPNVTADAFGLCFKTGNVVILRGGSDAIHSNLAVTKVIREGLKKCNLPEDALLLVENTDRAVVNQMMKLNKYIDVLIPRGGAGLIANVVQNSTVPVIETGTGNCHILWTRLQTLTWQSRLLSMQRHSVSAYAMHVNHLWFMKNRRTGHSGYL